MPQQDLDAAIKKLIESGASDEDITFFIQNYKKPEGKTFQELTAESQIKPILPDPKVPEIKIAPQQYEQKEPFFKFPLAGKIREIAESGSISPMDMYTPTIEAPGLREAIDLAPGGMLPFKGLEKIFADLALSAAEGATSPGGIATAAMGGFPQTRSLIRGGLQKLAPRLFGGAAEAAPEVAPQVAAGVGKLRLRLNPDKTYTNLDTGEVIDLGGNPVGTVSPTQVDNATLGEQKTIMDEATITPPTTAGVPQFNPRGRTGMTGSAQTGQPFDPSKLVGMAKSVSPEQPPKYKITRGGEVLDRETGERIGSLARQKKEEPLSPGAELANLPRAIQSSYDLSFPFRQGVGLAHTAGWWQSWDDMVKALGKQDAYNEVMESILERPNFKRSKLPNGKEMKSFAEEAGLDITDLVNHREEQMYSRIAENIPGIRASNRAYTAFGNKLRADVFDQLIAGAEKQGLNPKKNLHLAKQIAQYVNIASGRGSLGSLEKVAPQLAAMFFSPKLMASRVQMLNQIFNPFTYRAMPAYVKKQYWKSMASVATNWMTFASLAAAAGAEVSMDPDSADFGKIKIGNTRLDPGGGFQQYLVLAHRMYSGQRTASTSGKSIEFGSRFGAPTRLQAVEDFIVNKLAPVPATGAAFLGATKKRPFEVADESVRMVTPIIMQDILEAFNEEDPNFLPIIPAALGFGVQTYGERGKGQRVIPDWLLPRESDIQFKGGRFFQ